jgi:hypothetical protein
LEIGAPPATGLRNLIRNPSGERGAWGWHVTDAGTLSSNKGAKDYRPGGTLTFSSVAAVAPGVVTRFESEAWAIAPGQFAGASFWLVTAASAGTIVSYKMVIRDAAGQEIYAGSPNTTGTAGSKYGVPTTAAAPAGSASVHLRFDVTNPGTAVRSFAFREAMLVVGASGAAVNSPNFAEPLVWTDVLAPALNVETDRSPLGLGILSARIRSASLDPATNTLVRPGRPIRLMAYSTGALGWEPLFWGKIQDGRTSYDPAYPIASKRALIEISATDAGDELANTPEATSHRQIRSIRNKVRDTGVPFEIDTTTDNKNESDTIVATNENSSVLDQVALTRDTARSFAAVTRFGVLRAIDRQYMNVDNLTSSPSDPLMSNFTTTDYNADAVIDYDTRRVVNTVLIRCLYIKDDGTTTDGVFGPYVDAASVQEWGAFQSTYTIAGVEDETSRKFRAGEILKETKTLTRRVSEITFPVTDEPAFYNNLGSDLRVHLDLLDRVTVANPTAGISGEHRVAGIKHVITPTKWLVKVRFGSQAGTPAPRSQAAVPIGQPENLPDTPWVALPLINGWTNYGSGYTVAQYRRLRGVVYLRGLVVGTARTQGHLATLPAGFRHTGGTQLWWVSADPSGSRVDTQDPGYVVWSAGGTTAYVSLSGISYPAEA